MKSYLPLLLAGLGLAGSCSSPEPPSNQEGPTQGVPADYTVLTASDGLFQAEYFHTDGQAPEPAAPANPFAATGLPSLLYRDTGSISYLESTVGCPSLAAWYDTGAGDYLQREVLEGFDPCQTEVLALFHAGTDLYLGLQNTEGGDKPPAYWLRHISMEGGVPLDLSLPARPVDLARIGERIFVLTLDALDTQQNTLEIITADLLEPLSSLDAGTGARTLLRLDPSRLLLSYPEKHLVFDAQSLAVLKTVRYQAGLEPGFCGRVPLVSSDGNRLFYLYPAPADGGGSQLIPAQFELNRNTAVFYYFDNFLSPVELDIQYDVMEASAIGYDAGNNFLLVGYARRQDPGLGGVFRLDIGQEFRLVDHTALTAPPVALFSR